MTDDWEYSYILGKPESVPQGAVVEYRTSTTVDPKSPKAAHLLYFDWTAVNAANKDDLAPVQVPANPLFTTGVRAR